MNVKVSTKKSDPKTKNKVDASRHDQESKAQLLEIMNSKKHSAKVGHFATIIYLYYYGHEYGKKFTLEELAALFNTNRQTLHEYKKLYESFGAKAIERSRLGNPRNYLTDQQMTELRLYYQESKQGSTPTVQELQAYCIQVLQISLSVKATKGLLETLSEEYKGHGRTLHKRRT